jgi:hypothetical protein
MYISLQEQHATYPWLIRWSGRVGGVIVVIAWITLVIAEFARLDGARPTAIAYYQAATLALVFAGYAIGWWKELAGGVLVLLGTVAFFAVYRIMFDMEFGSWPEPGAACFAVPGLLYLLSWKFNKRANEIIVQPQRLSQHRASHEHPQSLISN